MTGHFFKNIKLREMILESRPSLIVECGAGEGACTRLLSHLHSSYPFQLVSITDKALPEIPGVEWRLGLSYEKLKELDEGSVGLCIIDTDHNYWTLMEELHALTPKLKEGGVIVIHDVDDFYHSTGMGMAYWNGAPYPEEKILESSKLGGLGLALIDFLHVYRGDFQLTHWTQTHHGCAVIKKNTVKKVQVIRPGTNPVFAPPPA